MTTRLEPSPIILPPHLPITAQSSSRARTGLIPPTTADRHPRRSSSHTSLLGPVPEDPADQSCWRSSRRNMARPGSSQNMQNGSSGMSRRSSAEDMGEWVIDPEVVKEGKGKWVERERVVLVLGECPEMALYPLSSNPTFSHTLLLTPKHVQTTHTYPSIQQLSTSDLEYALHEATLHSTAYRKKNKKKYRANYTPSSSALAPFDAILHFIPSALHYDPTQALQKMLREAIMATTIVTASLASSSSGSTSGKGKQTQVDMPITLVHVLPPDSPKALPLVIERYLLQLLPSLNKSRGSRIIRPLIISSSAWDTGSIPIPPGLASIEPILFGGYGNGLAPSCGSTSNRLYLSDWDHVIPPSTAFPRESGSGSGSSNESAPDQPWTWAMDRRDSSASTSSASSAPHELLTPLDGSLVDVNKQARVAPSRLSNVETVDQLDEGEVMGVERKRGLFGWMKRKI